MRRIAPQHRDTPFIHPGTHLPVPVLTMQTLPLPGVARPDLHLVTECPIMSGLDQHFHAEFARYSKARACVASDDLHKTRALSEALQDTMQGAVQSFLGRFSQQPVLCWATADPTPLKMRVKYKVPAPTNVVDTCVQREGRSVHEFLLMSVAYKGVDHCDIMISSMSLNRCH